MINKAFILAAGYGTRMRPLTDSVPKPLVTVAGQSLLERSLDQLQAAGVRDVMINTHYLAEKITARLSGRDRPRLHFSHEEKLLDTGGGIKNALAFFEGQPFYVLSGDGFWDDAGAELALARMAAVWDAEAMDMLMLLQPTVSMKLTHGVGDYDLDEHGRATRSLGQNGAYMFTSMRINHPRIFEAAPDGPFSYLKLMDEAQRKNRLFGLINQGQWHHISTPEDLKRVDQAYSESAA